MATHDEGSIQAKLMMDLDVLIPLREHRCIGVLPREAPTLQQVRWVSPIMRGNYEKPRGSSVADECYLPWIATLMAVGTT